MAEKAANALNRLTYCTAHGVSVDVNTLLDSVFEYFADDDDQPDSVHDDDSEDLSQLRKEDQVLESLHLPENPDYASVMKELSKAEKEARSGGNSDDDDGEEDDVDDEKDKPTVIVDQGETILRPVVDTLVYDDVEKERQRVSEFQCKCKEYDAGRCIKQFSTDYIMTLRMNLNAVTDGEKEMYVQGKVSCTIHLSEDTTCAKRKQQKKRSRYRTTFMMEGKFVCRKAFKFMHCIGNDRLDRIIQAYAAGEVGPLEKNSGGRVESARVLSLEDIKRIVNFLSNFAEAHAMVLPGRVPGFKRDDIKLLPSHETRMSVWRKYKAAMEESGHRAAQETSFRNIWNRLLPFIVRTRPMSDICWMCQKNNAAIYRSASLPVVVKNAKLKKQQDHLEIVTKERSLYREMVRESKAAVGETKLSQNEPCSKDSTPHYSFDFAQQVHLPSNPLQPGPIYFLVPRKVGIFGVNCESTSQQVNYLIDESMCSSKGSNAVISYLDHFFVTWGLGEKHVNLHCDNCSGQNKNKFVIWYFLWRTLHKLHLNVTLNFMIAGHTKFAPDQCFGLFKQAFRRTEVNCLQEMAKCVTDSSPEAGVNIPQLVGNEAGDIFVHLRDWQTFLHPYFKALYGIKKLHHMRFDANEPGAVFVKETCDGEECMIQLLKKPGHYPPATLPDAVPPPGLDKKRQWYLFTKIREFCSETTQDIVCPRPVGPEVTMELEDEEIEESPARKKKPAMKGRRQNNAEFCKEEIRQRCETY